MASVINEQLAREIRQFIKNAMNRGQDPVVQEETNSSSQKLVASKKRSLSKSKVKATSSQNLLSVSEERRAEPESLQVRFFSSHVHEGKGQTTLEASPIPVEVLTPHGWVCVQDIYLVDMLLAKVANERTKEEQSIYEEYQAFASMFGTRHLEAKVILETTDLSEIDIKGKDNLPSISDAIEQHEEIPFSREFVWVDGAKDTKGIIVLPYDDYDKVFVVSDADHDGKNEITFLQSKEETNGVRPYFEKKNGKTYLYVNHFSGGGGTQADPYIVSNEQDLNNVRNNLGAWYVQDQDIVMGSFQSGEGFEPIGASNTPFTGNYDGRGHFIKGLFMNRNRNHVGLFGTGRSAIIRNLRLIDPNITNEKQTTGALIGYIVGCKIFNCNVIGGTVEGRDGKVGGLVGDAYAYSVHSNWATEIKYCYNYKCNVKTGGNIAGGLVGNVYWDNNGVYMDNCYSTGKVEDITVAKDRTNIGGLVGYYSNNSNATNCFWDLETSGAPTSAAGIGKATSEMKDKDTYSWDFDLYWDVNKDVNEGYPEHRQFIRYKTGKGTQAEPYIITTEDELNQIRWFRHSRFKVEDDIKMVDHQTNSGFYPIGFSLIGQDDYFRGSFDGGGRCIANLFINLPSNSYAGLFGQITGATIQNLDIIDCNVTGGGSTGSLVGYSINSLIKNCHVDTFSSCRIISKGDYAGALIGHAYSNTIIEDCSANANMIGVSYIGGFIGTITGSNISVKRSYSKGRVEGTSYVAGFIGHMGSSNSSIEDCYTSCDVIGSHVAGFVGYITTGNFKQCNAIGTIYGKGGGFTYDHYSPNSKTLTECYFDRQTYKTTTGGYGGIPKYTAELKHPSLYTNWDMNTTWILDTKYNDGYPALRNLLPIDPPILGFRNEFGKYYTDNAGGLLRYLDFGTLIASQTSLPKAVWLQNNAEFPVNRIQVWVDKATVEAGMDVKLSISETPFIGISELEFSGTYAPGAASKFYVRVGSDITVKQGGTFDLKAKASPA
ncbi:filamentous hemagglutinin [Brevibacillus laterosporus]|uniref:filamentous hemagglutinin n=1 Tax=Brevibacillus laterosporus TaxID=1465 RepID=UPI003D1E1C82